MTDQPFIAPDTDNLDDFNALFTGKAKPAEAPSEAPVEEAVEGDVLDTQEDPTEVDTGDDASELEVEEAPAPTEKPKKKTAQDRIKELTAEKYERDRLVEAERVRNAELAAKLADLEARLPKVVPTLPPVQDEGPSPTAVDADGEMLYPLGEFDPKFIRDLTKYTIAQERKNDQAEAERASLAVKQQEYNQTLEKEWQGKVAVIEATIPDFREKGLVLEKTLTGLNPQYGEYLARTIMAMDHGPEVLNHLAENPTLAQEIVNKGPQGATIALGRIEARFLQSEKPKARVSSAPPKIAPTARGVAVGGEVKGDTDDLDAFSQAFFTKKRR